VKSDRQDRPRDQKRTRSITYTDHVTLAVSQPSAGRFDSMLEPQFSDTQRSLAEERRAPPTAGRRKYKIRGGFANLRLIMGEVVHRDQATRGRHVAREAFARFCPDRNSEGTFFCDSLKGSPASAG